jgi:tetratricopeptide (TPR) repeat protein
VFVFRIEALRAPSTLEERRAEIDEAFTIADELDDAVAKFWLANWKQFQLLEVGQYDSIPTLVEDARRLADRLGQPLLRWQSTFIRSLHASLSGDVEAAEELATEAFQIANDTGQPDGLVVFGANLFSIRWHQGRLAELPELWQQTIIEHPGVPIYRASLAFMYCELGRLEEARELLEPMVTNAFADVAYDSLWLPTLHVWAGAAAGVGDRRAAEVLYDLMSPWSGVISSTGANVLGPVSEMLGRLAIVLDRRDDAVAHLRNACAVLEHMRAPFLLARCELALGDLTGDRALIESALARSREFGCPEVERQAMQRLA